MEKPFLKFIQNLNESQIVKTENTEKGRINSSFFQYWNKKNKAEGVTLPDFKTHYKSVILKTVWSWHKDQLTTKESSQINSHTYWSMVFGKTPRLFNGEKAVPSTNVEGKLDIHTKKNKVDSLPNNRYKVLTQNRCIPKGKT